MPQPDPAACCPDAYYCPAAGQTECPRHPGFTLYCEHPHGHIPMDRATWHQAQERLEQRWLWELHQQARAFAAWCGRDVGPGAEEAAVLGLVLYGPLATTLGTVTPSTLGTVHAITTTHDRADPCPGG